MFLDTNVLLLAARTGFPIDREVDLARPGAPVAVPSSVVSELDRLVDRGVRGARIARALAQRYPVVRVEGRGDAAILAGALRRSAWVVTADRELVERLRRSGVPVLVPRDRQRLEPREGRRPAARSASTTSTAEPVRRRQRL